MKHIEVELECFNFQNNKYFLYLLLLEQHGLCSAAIFRECVMFFSYEIITLLIYCSSVEISPSLAKKQQETVGEVNSHLAKFRVECRDAADPNGWGMLP